MFFTRFSRTKDLVALLVFFTATLLLLPCHGEMIFPEILPPESTAVFSVPQTEAAWRAWENMPTIREAERFLQNQGKGVVSGEELFTQILSASELAVIPSASPSSPLTFLWIGRVKDQARLRQVIARFEENAMRRVVSADNPVTRANEGIGDTALVFLTDRKSTLGYFLNGPTATCAFSNDAGTLRKAARRLAAMGTSPSKGKNAKSSEQAQISSTFAEPLRAWHEMESSKGGKQSFHLRFFIPSPPALAGQTSNPFGVAGGGTVHDPLARSASPQPEISGGHGRGHFLHASRY